MIAAFLNRTKQIELKKVKIPEPKAGEVRIKLKMIGVFGSDVHLFLGHRLLQNTNPTAYENRQLAKTMTNNEFEEYIKKMQE